MKEKIRKIYMSKKLLVASSIIAICFLFADAIQAIINGQTHDYAWILIALILLLLWSFFKGHINVQKMLFGAILLYMIMEQCAIINLDASFGGAAVAIDFVFLILSIIVFVSHMYQQMDHKGRKGGMFINQILGLIAFGFLFYAISNLIAAPTTIGYYTFLFGYVFTCIMVICMETRVATYKQIRDKARAEGTWTEETRREAKKLFKL